MVLVQFINPDTNPVRITVDQFKDYLQQVKDGHDQVVIYEGDEPKHYFKVSQVVYIGPVQ